LKMRRLDLVRMAARRRQLPVTSEVRGVMLSIIGRDHFGGKYIKELTIE